jgi:hypothetical protein
VTIMRDQDKTPTRPRFGTIERAAEYAGRSRSRL